MLVRSLSRSRGLLSAVLGAALLAVGSAFVAAPAAQASTCVASPGVPGEITELGAGEACGAVTDGGGQAWASGDGGVGFAESRGGAQVAAFGTGGGTGAAESFAGFLAAVGVGEGSLALGVLDDPGTAFVLTGPRSQAYIGDLSDPVLCEGEAAVAANLSTGQGCVVFGDFRWSTGAPQQG